MQEDLKSAILERYQRLPKKDRAARLADAAGLTVKVINTVFKSGKAARETSAALERGLYQLEMEEHDAAPEVEAPSAPPKAPPPPARPQATKKPPAAPQAGPDPWVVGREIDTLLGKVVATLATLPPDQQSKILELAAARHGLTIRRS